MTKLNGYTKKIIKRLAVVSAMVGVLFLAASAYIEELIFAVGGLAFLVAAYMAYGIANSKYEAD